MAKGKIRQINKRHIEGSRNAYLRRSSPRAVRPSGSAAITTRTTPAQGVHLLLLLLQLPGHQVHLHLGHAGRVLPRAGLHHPGGVRLHGAGGGLYQDTARNLKRPKTIRAPKGPQCQKQLKQIGKLIREDHRLSIRGLAEIIGIDKECVRQILHESFNMRKFCARMVSKLLTPEQKESRLNICADILNNIDTGPGLLDTVTLKGTRFESVEADTTLESRRKVVPEIGGGGSGAGGVERVEVEERRMYETYVRKACLVNNSSINYVIVLYTTQKQIKTCTRDVYSKEKATRTI
ncbi:hypothetical protein NQ318_018407 [Aromia moschata]|uniref:Uncharacterized protein n=1 Tax=Aromia moschata TaxID=1265417 RepID=A0AAV8X2I7_9CUCU|nr:hypothetical protein NQ318_018407 [Aromia moschata]